MKIAILLHNIRSAHNVGSIFRTAESAGVERIYLSGHTPAPIDRFGRVEKKIEKTALGAEKMLPWEYHASPMTIIKKLSSKGGSSSGGKGEVWAIVGVEQDTQAVDYRKFKMRGPTLFIFGNEVKGLSSALRAKCDTLIEIPMHGSMIRHARHPRHTKRGKESLNVSVAAGIVLFRAVDSH